MIQKNKDYCPFYRYIKKPVGFLKDSNENGWDPGQHFGLDSEQWQGLDIAKYFQRAFFSSNSNVYPEDESSLLRFYRFVLKNVTDKNKKILSIGCGMAGLEMKLLQEGYSVVCSDLKIYPFHHFLKKLFPESRFLEIDMFHPQQLEELFDVVIMTGVLGYCSPENLQRLFQILSGFLKKNGEIIVDDLVSPPSFWADFFYEKWYPVEATIINFYSWLFGRFWRLYKKQASWRYTTDFFVGKARESGFQLKKMGIEFFHRDFLYRFYTTRLITKMIGTKNALYFFSKLGRVLNLPYRIFHFKEA